MVQITVKEARAIIAAHAGSAEGFADGYAYALRYGFGDDVEEIQQKFDDILISLKVLFIVFGQRTDERFKSNTVDQHFVYE